ncbi:phage tail protein [Peptostreptococcus faecalis]|uniref:phage tail protein n=1 Tax=Peptostreptococcus faecalis TaxID=2045015 RepID=UPI000C7AD015|nr:phage tail protein [Peptostreptococcus faecalis]
MGEHSVIQLKIPKYYLDIFSQTEKIYPLFKEIKNERRIILNENEVFLIKSIETQNEQVLELEAKTSEIRLAEIDVELEDCGLSFFQEDEESEILSLDKYLYQESGWKLGEVTDLVKYEPGTETERVRWIENVEKKWYDFITKDLCESFDCMVSFDSWNKTIDFFKEEELVDEIGLYLSKDNYIKSLEREYDSDKIVTRLKVVGNDEMDIIGSVCTGEPYIEDYTYFLENDEMTEELIEALKKYYEIVIEREKIWKRYVDERVKKLEEKRILGSEHIDLEAQITALEDILEEYERPPGEDKVRAAEIISKITKLRDRKSLVISSIEFLEEELKALEGSINNIITLCKKPTATDNEGNLIFTKELLEELMNYNYTEIYKNDSFLTENVGELIELAKRKLREKSYPTRKWDIDVVNFLERLNPLNRLNWNGQMSLGDLVILYDRENDTEEFIYFTGYSHKVRSNELSIKLSNKKTVKEDGITIADYLTQAKNAMRAIDAKKYLFIQQKYNRLNLPKEYIPKYKEKERDRPEGIIID